MHLNKDGSPRSDSGPAWKESPHLRREGCPGIKRAMSVCWWAEPCAESGGESLARVTMVRLGFEMPYLQVELPDPIDPCKRFSPSLQKATPMRSEERIGVAKAQVKPSGCRCRRQATPA